MYCNANTAYYIVFLIQQRYHRGIRGVGVGGHGGQDRPHFRGTSRLDPVRGNDVLYAPIITDDVLILSIYIRM